MGIDTLSPQDIGYRFVAALPVSLIAFCAAFGGWLEAGLALLARVVRGLRAVEGPVPWNAWLHGDGHPHLELVPRLTPFAGAELGAGIWMVEVGAEDAAAALVRALAP